MYVLQSQGSDHSPDWLMKNATSSLKIGVLRSRKSDDNSTITGSSVSSSTNWRLYRMIMHPCSMEHRTCIAWQCTCKIVTNNNYYDGQWQILMSNLNTKSHCISLTLWDHVIKYSLVPLTCFWQCISNVAYMMLTWSSRQVLIVPNYSSLIHINIHVHKLLWHSTYC